MEVEKKNSNGFSLIVSISQRIMTVLPSDERQRMFLVILLLLVNSLLDVLGLGVILPLIILILEENAIQSNEILSEIYRLLGFTQESYFILCVCGVVVSVIVLKNVISLAILHFQSHFSQNLQKRFSGLLFKAYYSRGFLYIKSSNSSNILRDVVGVPSSFSIQVFLPLLTVINELIVVTLIAGGLLVFNYKVIVLLVLVVGPTFYLFYMLVKNKIQHIAEGLHSLSPLLSRNLFEAVFGYVDVIITNSKRTFFERHDEVQQDMVKFRTQEAVFKLAPTKIVETSMYLGIIVIIVYGVFNFSDRTDLIALLGVFALAAYRVLPSVNRIMTSVMSIKAYEYTIDVIERIHQFPYADEPEAPSALPFERAISIEGLSFSYANTDLPVLADVSLSIQKGEVIGMIGKSGSGKSTLVNLMLGLLSPSQGQITVDGQIIHEHLTAWRSNIGYVQQEIFLVDGSLRDNVAFGQMPEEVDDEKVLKALEMASLGDFIKSGAESLEMLVGERGSKLSGGQRQRVGIARALYRGAKVLFFDEATSALDMETEREITDAVKRLSAHGLTMVIVAHRITTLKYCDRIYEIDQGRILHEKAYQELIDKAI